MKCKMTEKVVDGADRRKIRLLDLLHFIHTQGGATSEDIQAFMTLKYGLKHKTTSEYILKNFTYQTSYVERGQLEKNGSQREDTQN